MSFAEKNSWYFAYGSNLAVERMVSRIETTVRAAIRCRLLNYRLAFNKKSSLAPGHVFANIAHSPNDEVWGVAYLCNAKSIQLLDGYEGVSEGHYERIEVNLVTDESRNLQAFTYIAGPNFLCDEGIPAEEYVNIILSGARHHHLPNDYIQRIERHVGRLKIV